MRRLFVYALGDSGVYSEVNNLLLAHAYVEVMGGRLMIDSRSWCGSVDRGWADYFSSGRAVTRLVPVLNNHRGARMPWRWRWGIARWVRLLPSYWMEMRDPAFWRRRLPDQMGWDELFAMKQRALAELYRFTPEVALEVQAMSAALQLPSHYAAVHIRRGDKISVGEMENIPIARYAGQLDFLACDDIFVATDDHEALQEFMQAMPVGVRVHSLCLASCQGYLQQSFNAAAPEVRRGEIMRLLAEVELLSGAQRMVCSFSSNVSRFVALRLGRENCLSLDEDWHPW